MNKIDIRPSEAADIPGLGLVLEDTQLFPAEMLPEMLDNPEEGIWLTAFRDAEVLGLCYARPEMLADGVWNMLALGVRTEAHGQTVGTALVADLETRLRADGVRMVIVETSGTADFAQARGFYVARGYAQEAVIRDYWEAGDDKVIFRKLL